MTDLIPPDRERCQAERHHYSPFTMGGNVHKTVRCANKPVLIITETAPGSDGKKGSMALCAHCYAVFHKQFPTKPLALEALP